MQARASNGSAGAASGSPTVRAIAREAGVSASTVSRVLRSRDGVSADARRRVMEAIARLGSTPDEVRLSTTRRLRALSRSAAAGARLLALIVPDVSTGFYAEVLRGVEAEAYERGYTLVLYTTAGRGHDQVVRRALEAGQCDGLIIMTPRGESPRTLRQQAGVPLPPVVVVDHRAEGSPYPHIAVDNLKGAIEATNYLIGKGYRRIAFITGLLTIQSAVDRLRGYRLALEEAGIGFDPAWVIQGDFLTPSGYRAVKEWLEQGRPLPDAWFCSNDLMAFGALKALHEAGISVPGDTAVMGFDDIPLAQTTLPPLTTVAQPMAEMGALAVRMVVGMIEGGGVAVPRVVLQTRLVIRESA
ncbi:MAG TPA: LacI family DNA-binding transcriptional regulator [Limnochordales bacterium]